MPNNNGNQPPGKLPPRAGTISRHPGQVPPADLRRTQQVQRSPSTPLDREAPTAQGRLAQLPDLPLAPDGQQTLGYDSSQSNPPLGASEGQVSTDLTRERVTSIGIPPHSPGVVYRPLGKATLEDPERSGAQ